jgi:hypothetical protein
MGKKSRMQEGNSQMEILEKLLMLDLFKLGVPQSEIGKKLKMNIVEVNSFLKGIKRKEK